MSKYYHPPDKWLYYEGEVIDTAGPVVCIKGYSERVVEGEVKRMEHHSFHTRPDSEIGDKVYMKTNLRQNVICTEPTIIF